MKKRIRWIKYVNLGRSKLNSPGCPNAARREVRLKFWRGISDGVATEASALAAGVSTAVGNRWFRHNGGMAPQIKIKLSGRYLSFEEREEIALLDVQGLGVRGIALKIARSPSTISRELRRNSSTRGGKLECRASVAQWHCDRKAMRPKISKLAANERLRIYVQERLLGKVKSMDGKELTGPKVKWIGRRHGRR